MKDIVRLVFEGAGELLAESVMIETADGGAASDHGMVSLTLRMKNARQTLVPGDDLHLWDKGMRVTIEPLGHRVK